MPGAAVAAAPKIVEEELLGVETDTVDVAGEGMVMVVSVPDVSEEEDEAEDEEEAVVVLTVSDAVPVPSVVGVAKELGLWVSGTFAVVKTIADGAPEALASTVAARSLAVPQPNCENPPSNILL